MSGADLAFSLRRNRNVILPFVLFVIVFVGVNLLARRPFNYSAFDSLVGSGGTLALAAMGQSLVVMTGGFDLSAGAVISLVNVITASTMTDSLSSEVGVTLLGLAVGAAVGAVNGFFVAILRMQAIVVTLATLFIVEGLALLVRNTPGGSIPVGYTNFLSGDVIPGVLPAGLVVILLAVVLWLAIKNTRFGTAIYAVGSDMRAASSAGIPVRSTKFMTYVLAGAFYGAAGLFVSAQTGGSDPLVGTPMLLQIFTAVVLGGTMLGGGRGGLVGPVIGAYLLMLFVNVLLILNVSDYYSSILDGAVLLVAVLAGSGVGEGSAVSNLQDVARHWSSRVPRYAGWPGLADGAGTGHESATTTPSWLHRNQEVLRSVLPSYAALIIVVAVTGIYFHGIGTKYVFPLLVLSSFLAILAFGQGTVILTGGLDLSVPWTIAGCAVVFAALVHGQSSIAIWAIPTVLLIGAIVGLVNGLGITLLGLPPMVMTLAMNGILEGLTLIYSNGTPLGFGPPVLKWLMTGKLVGITPVIWFMVVFIAFAVVILDKTPLGRRIYAVGNSARVAYLSGINVRRVLTTAYVISGLASSLVGILLVGFDGQASLGMGDDFLLPSIAVVVAGGTLITGGKGHYIGMLGGALMLTALQILLEGTPLPYAIRDVVLGAVVLGALVTLRERRMA